MGEPEAEKVRAAAVVARAKAAAWAGARARVAAEARAASVAPGDARGWMTLAQVAEANDIPIEEIVARFDLPADIDPATELRDLESETFSVSVLRAGCGAVDS